MNKINDRCLAAGFHPAGPARHIVVEIAGWRHGCCFNVMACEGAPSTTCDAVITKDVDAGLRLMGVKIAVGGTAVAKRHGVQRRAIHLQCGYQERMDGGCAPQWALKWQVGGTAIATTSWRAQARHPRLALQISKRWMAGLRLMGVKIAVGGTAVATTSWHAQARHPTRNAGIKKEVDGRPAPHRR